MLLLTLAVIFSAALLRSPIVAIAPVASDIRMSFGVSTGTVGLLTSIPVLCFAVCAPIAIAIVRRGGATFALTVTLAGAVLAMVVRSAGGLAAALIGTALLGMFLTIGNVVVPLIISREYPPHRAQQMTGVYTSAINAGTATVTLTTAPLAASFGWRSAILVWAMFGVAALAAWIGLHGLRGAMRPIPSETTQTGIPQRSALRTASTWLLAAAFAGQAFAFYSTTAWLPSLLKDQGYAATAAGAIAAIFQVTGIAGALLIPQITTRRGPLAGVVVVATGWLAVPIGFLIAPALWPVWCSVGGLAQAGGLTVVFIMIAGFGGDDRNVAARSGTVQGIGYGVAATGPPLVGALHDATGGWTVSLLVILAAVLLFGTAGVLAAAQARRERT